MSKFFKLYSYKSLCLENVSDEWLNDNCLSMKKSTLQKYTYIINNHIKTSLLSKISIINIKTKNFTEFSRKLLNDGLSAKTVNDILLVLNQILKYCNEKYDVPNIKIQYVKEAKKEMRV